MFLFCTLFTRGHNFYDFLFAFPIGVALSKLGLLLKEKIAAREENYFLRFDLYEKTGTKFKMSELLPLKVYPFTLLERKPIFNSNSAFKGLLHWFFLTCIEITGTNWYCFNSKTVENCKEKLRRVKKL